MQIAVDGRRSLSIRAGHDLRDPRDILSDVIHSGIFDMFFAFATNLSDHRIAAASEFDLLINQNRVSGVIPQMDQLRRIEVLNSRRPFVNGL